MINDSNNDFCDPYCVVKKLYPLTETLCTVKIEKTVWISILVVSYLSN